VTDTSPTELIASRDCSSSASVASAGIRPDTDPLNASWNDPQAPEIPGKISVALMDELETGKPDASSIPVMGVPKSPEGECTTNMISSLA